MCVCVTASTVESIKSTMSHDKKPVEHAEFASQDNKGGDVELSSERPVLDEETNKKLLRKIDLRLMPVVRLPSSRKDKDSLFQMCFTYGLQYYDKALLSQAAVFGLRDDLGLQDGLRYSWVSLIFYFGYMAGCYPVYPSLIPVSSQR